MYTVPQTSLTLPAVVGRRLNEGLGHTANSLHDVLKEF